MRQVMLWIAIAATLAGCGRMADSRLNPFTWFGRDRAAPAVAEAELSRDPRPLADQVVRIAIDRTPGGAILTAVALPPTQGHWDGELVDIDTAPPGTLAYEFRLAPPPGPRRASTPASRQVVVATFLSEQTLAGIREIRIAGARAGRSLRR